MWKGCTAVRFVVRRLCEGKLTWFLIQGVLAFGALCGVHACLWGGGRAEIEFVWSLF